MLAKRTAVIAQVKVRDPSTILLPMVGTEIDFTNSLLPNVTVIAVKT